MKKNILFYSGSLRMGGIERVLVDVLQNFDREKYNIDLIIEDENKKLNIFEKDIPKYINLNYLRSDEFNQKLIYYREKRKSNIFCRIFYQLLMECGKYINKNRIKTLTKGKEYDAVIDFDMGLSKFIELIHTKKKIAWVHSNIETWYVKKSRIRRLGNRLKKYDKVVTICDEMMENTKKLYPFLAEKITRVYNPFNFERVRELANKSVDKKMKKFYDESYYVSVMRLVTDSKDFPTLIKGFKLAKEKGIQEKLYILGDGPDRKKVEKMIIDEGMENEIILFGNVKNPYPWIKGAKALIHSSKYEGLPTVLIEGLILNKKVISSNCPTGPTEILEYGKIGDLYTVGDYEKLGNIFFKNMNEDREFKWNIDQYNVVTVMKEYERVIGE